jgi:hypothetical protein
LHHAGVATIHCFDHWEIWNPTRPTFCCQGRGIFFLQIRAKLAHKSIPKPHRISLNGVRPSLPCPTTIHTKYFIFLSLIAVLQETSLNSPLLSNSSSLIHRDVPNQNIFLHKQKCCHNVWPLFQTLLLKVNEWPPCNLFFQSEMPKYTLPRQFF